MFGTMYTKPFIADLAYRATGMWAELGSELSGFCRLLYVRLASLLYNIRVGPDHI